MRQFPVVILLLAFSVAFLPAQEADRKFVYFYSDSSFPVQVGDSTAIKSRGNVIFYHNGAVVTCDSSLRYNNLRIDCFGRVVINQNTTYIYGDRAEYNGEVNQARVFAPIIKVVDEDATMYTRNFTFNTLDKVGHYFGDGTMQQQENSMESREGYYYADERKLIGVGDVEMRNPDYQMRSDSVIYDMNTEIASFYAQTYIWTDKGEIISAKEGEYDNLASVYRLKKEAYIYDGEKELWSDSLVYNSIEDNVWLYSNIQMLDNDQGTLAFGDYGQYWGNPQNALLTQNPSLVSLDKQKADTLFLRADSIYLNTFDKSLVLNVAGQPKQTLAAGEELITPAPGREPRVDEQRQKHEQAQELLDSLTQANLPPEAPSPDDADDGQVTDEDVIAEEIATDGVTGERVGDEPVAQPAPPTKEERRRIRDEEKRLVKEAKVEAKKQKQAERDAKILAKRLERAKRNEPEHDHAHTKDSLALSSDILGADSLRTEADSLSVVMPTPEVRPEESGDSLQRVIRAYYDVKIFRGDVQAVCDSLIGFSIDSTLHMYIDPVLWNGANQMTADIIDVYMKDGKLDRAFFSGEPIMVSEVEPGQKYNQVKGKTMQSSFRDNELYRHDVNANARTLYYMQDDDTGDYMGLITVESADVSFLLDSMQMQDIIWRGEPSYTIYPMDKIAPSVELELPGFAWHEARKPSRLDVFDRVIRDSRGQESDSMPTPLFPLTKAILQDRDNKIRTGQWVERNDRLTPFMIEKLRGFDPDYGREPDDETRRSGSNVIELREDALPVSDSVGVEGIEIAPASPDSTLQAGEAEELIIEVIGGEGVEEVIVEEVVITRAPEPADDAEEIEEQPHEDIQITEDAGEEDVNTGIGEPAEGADTIQTVE